MPSEKWGYSSWFSIDYINLFRLYTIVGVPGPGNRFPGNWSSILKVYHTFNNRRKYDLTSASHIPWHATDLEEFFHAAPYQMRRSRKDIQPDSERHAIQWRYAHKDHETWIWVFCLQRGVIIPPRSQVGETHMGQSTGGSSAGPTHTRVNDSLPHWSSNLNVGIMRSPPWILTYRSVDKQPHYW